MSNQVIKETRLEMRISASIKATIEKAAVISGKSLSSYATSTLQEQAQKDIREYEMLSLNNHDRDRFLDLMSNPPEANDDLKKLMRG